MKRWWRRSSPISWPTSIPASGAGWLTRTARTWDTSFGETSGRAWHCQLRRLLVVPAARGMGIGRALVDDVFALRARFATRKFALDAEYSGVRSGDLRKRWFPPGARRTRSALRQGSYRANLGTTAGFVRLRRIVAAKAPNSTSRTVSDTSLAVLHGENFNTLVNNLETQAVISCSKAKLYRFSSLKSTSPSRLRRDEPAFSEGCAVVRSISSQIGFSLVGPSDLVAHRLPDAVFGLQWPATHAIKVFRGEAESRGLPRVGSPCCL